jgi:hypothetical protein
VGTGTRWLIGVGVVVVASAVAAVLVVRADDRSPFERAERLVADRTGFETGLEAGETIARVAQHLERAVAECRTEGEGATCQALSSALGWSQVLATWVLDCTDPGREEARARLAAYLEEVDAVASAAQRVPSPPELPACH